MTIDDRDSSGDGTGRRPTGVCVIRAEPLDRARLLISVISTLDVENAAVETSPPVTKPEQALARVARFLADCAKSVSADREPGAGGT